jgi:hypothetical protein
MIKLVKSAKEDRLRNVQLQNERKMRCWTKVAEMNKSRVKPAIIWVTTSCSFYLKGEILTDLMESILYVIYILLPYSLLKDTANRRIARLSPLNRSNSRRKWC